MNRNLKTAISYDWTNQIGGAERLVEKIADIFPNSDLYTSVYNPKNAPWADKFRNVYPSFINSLPFSKRKYHWYFLLMAYAFENFNFNKYDLVISVTSYPGKFIVTTPKTCHISYCLAPTRFLWEKENTPKFIFPFLYKHRIADQLAAKRADFTFTSCKNTAEKIRKYYRVNADIIYPEIDTDKFTPGVKKENYFLIVSRLVKYKKIDLAIRAFNKLDYPLKIIGTGREEKYLKSIAKKNIQFLGTVDDQTLIRNYQNCKAVIFPQEEDFGLVPLEAQACGKPVIAFLAGGAQETVLPGKTGEFFSSQTESSLIELLKNFDEKKYLAKNCRRNALRFRKGSFFNCFKERSLERLKEHQQSF